MTKIPYEIPAEIRDLTAKSVEEAPAQNKSNRRDRPPHLPGYGGQALAAQSLDLVFSRRRQPGRARARGRDERSIRPASPSAR
jgi:hypothetical protein